MKNPQLLFSAKIKIAHMIEKKYYGRHFAYCASFIHSSGQPLTSDPFDLAYTYYKIAQTGERHHSFFKEKQSTLLTVAGLKRKDGLISKEVENKIKHRVKGMGHEDFYPLLYIIPFSAVRGHVTTVPIHQRAADQSVEYIVEDLRPGDFEIFDFYKFYSGLDRG